MGASRSLLYSLAQEGLIGSYRAFIISCCLLIVGSFSTAGAQVITTPETLVGRSDQALATLATAPHVIGELLVQFRAGTTQGHRAAALRRVDAVSEEVIVSENGRIDGNGNLELVRIPPGLAIATAVRGLEADASVVFAEPNWIYQHASTSNDPYYTDRLLWGMYGNATSPKNDFGSQAGQAWANNHIGTKEVYIGIIDTGVMSSHEDLAPNMWKNPKEADGVKGFDDDGNGLVDDIYGWDFDGGNNTVYDGTQDDHGTHVAGTIGAVGGNGKGVAGVCWNVTMIPVKFLGRNGGTTANAIKAVDYITDLRKRHGINIVATNNSWGGGGYSKGLEDAIERANLAEILFIAAAGNGGRDGVGDNNDISPHYPSSYTNANIISVAAITSSGSHSSFSNYGPTSVDLGAPGSGIYSTLPGKAGKGGTVTSKYGSYSGTSMATPHVTGAASLYAASHPDSTAAQIKEEILAKNTPTPSLAGKCVTGGRLNVSGF